MAAAGIAVIKTRLDQLLEGPSEVARYPNAATGTAKAIQRLRVLKSTGIVVGSIGGCRQSLLEACCDAGLWTARVCPCQAP